MSNQGPKAKYWVITSFDEEPPTWSPDNMKWLIYQQEKAPSTGKLHWQIFCAFHNRVRTTQIVKIMLLEKHPHTEVMSKNARFIDNKNYCSKGYTRVQGPFEYGEIPSEEERCVPMGKRTDLDRVATMVQDGDDDYKIAMEHPTTFVRYHKGIRELREVVKEPKLTGDLPEVWIITGERGAGKSSLARSLGKTAYSVAGITGNDGQGWFTGYKGEETIIFENINKPWAYDYSFLMKVLDRYPVQMPTKGGFIWRKESTKNIVFTSVDAPELWWGLAHNMEEFNRRVHKRIYMEHIDANLYFMVTDLSTGQKGVWCRETNTIIDETELEE